MTDKVLSDNYHWNSKFEIGRGSFSRVYRVIGKKTGEYETVKLMKTNDRFEDIQQDYGLLEQLKDNKYIVHPNWMHYVVLESMPHNILCIGTEYCNQHSLQSHIDANGCLNDDWMMCLLECLKEALPFLWKNAWIHRDIHPNNILVHIGARNNFIMKLCDVGGWKLLGERNSQLKHGAENSACKDNIVYWHPMLVRNYLRLSNFTQMLGLCVDMWSVGVTIFQAITGKVPFKPEIDGFYDLMCKIHEKRSDRSIYYENYNDSFSEKIPESPNYRVTRSELPDYEKLIRFLFAHKYTQQDYQKNDIKRDHLEFPEKFVQFINEFLKRRRIAVFVVPTGQLELVYLPNNICLCAKTVGRAVAQRFSQFKDFFLVNDQGYLHYEADDKITSYWTTTTTPIDLSVYPEMLEKEPDKDIETDLTCVIRSIPFCNDTTYFSHVGLDALILIPSYWKKVDLNAWNLSVDENTENAWNKLLSHANKNLERPDLNMDKIKLLINTFHKLEIIYDKMVAKADCYSRLEPILHCNSIFSEDRWEIKLQSEENEFVKAHRQLLSDLRKEMKLKRSWTISSIRVEMYRLKSLREKLENLRLSSNFQRNSGYAATNRQQNELEIDISFEATKTQPIPMNLTQYTKEGGVLMQQMLDTLKEIYENVRRNITKVLEIAFNLQLSYQKIMKCQPGQLEHHSNYNSGYDTLKNQTKHAVKNQSDVDELVIHDKARFKRQLSKLTKILNELEKAAINTQHLIDFSCEPLHCSVEE